LKVKEQFDEINESARKLYEKYKPKAQAVVEEDED